MRSLRLKILAGIAVFLSLLLTCVWLWQGVEANAERVARSRLTAYGMRLGIPLSFDWIELRPNGVRLHGFTAGDFLSAASITIVGSWNFSGASLQPESVLIQAPSIKTDQLPVALHEWTQNLLTNQDARTPQTNLTPNSSEEPRFRLLQSVRVELTHAEIHHDQAVVRITSASFDPKEKVLRGQIASQTDGLFIADFELDKTPTNAPESAKGATTTDKKWRFTTNFIIGDLQELSAEYPTLASKIPVTHIKQARGTLQVIEQPGFHTYHVSTRFSDLVVDHPRIGSLPIGPIPLSFAATIQTRLRQPRYVSSQNRNVEVMITDGRLAFEQNSARVAAAISASGLIADDLQSGPWLIKVRLPQTPCQNLLDVAPRGLAPAVEGFKLAGNLRFGFDLTYRPDSAEAVTYKILNSDVSCQIAAVPPRYAKDLLSNPLRIERRDVPGDPFVMHLEEGAPFFTPLARMGSLVTTTIVASEDVGFWTHKGIELGAIEEALRRNMSEKRIAVGGSTITMQTVKNLFLTHERTFSRKLQELFLAWHLDRELPKKRILELYLNIAELGPRIYGVTHAARHYFNKSPADLSLRESVFLAMLLPSPIKRHRYFCSGRTSPAFDDMMHGLLRRMHSLGRINFDQYVQASQENLFFHQPSRLASTACIGVKQIARESGSDRAQGNLAE